MCCTAVPREYGGRGNLRNAVLAIWQGRGFFGIGQRRSVVVCTSAVKRVRLQSVTLLLVLLPVAANAAAQTRAAGVTGVVRDAKGIPQMGALVQALLPDATPVGQAITDLKGHYLIRNLKPGKYQVRASAALYMPSMRGDLRLRAGAQAIVDLTLTTLFEESNWLPAERRQPDEPADEWKWSLRTAANRPILRLADEKDVVLISASAENNKRATHTRVEILGGNGFANGGLQNAVTYGEASRDGHGVLMRASGGVVSGPSSLGSATKGSVVYQQPAGMFGYSRTRISFQDHPEIVGQGGGNGYQAYTLDSAEVMNFGDTLALEVGSSLRAVRMGAASMEARPFVKLAMQPNEMLVFSYRMARSRELQGADDIDSADAPLPLAVLQNGRMLQERGLHQQLGVTVKNSKGSIRTAYYRDSIERPMIAGFGSVESSGLARGNMLVDANTSTARVMGDAYSSVGWSIAATEQLGQNLWTTLEVNTGDALSVVDSPVIGPKLHAGRAKSAAVGFKAQMPASGTQLRASYRWQSEQTVTPVNMFSGMSRQPYLSFSVRQPLRIRRFRLENMEAFLDVTNLLAQGYQPFLSSDGKTLYLAQSPRMLQAGVAFTF